MGVLMFYNIFQYDLFLSKCLTSFLHRLHLYSKLLFFICAGLNLPSVCLCCQTFFFFSSPFLLCLSVFVYMLAHVWCCVCVCVNLYVCVFDTTGTLWWELTQGWTKPSSVTIPWPLSKVCVRETLKGKCVYQHHWQTECNVEEKAEVEVFFIISFLEKS